MSRKITDIKKKLVQVQEGYDEPEDRNNHIGYELTSISPKTSGLPFFVHASELGDNSIDPFVRVSTSHIVDSYVDMTVVSINNPKIIKGYLDAKNFRLLKQFIALNKSVLLDYWFERNGMTSSRSLWDAIKPILLSEMAKVPELDSGITGHMLHIMPVDGAKHSCRVKVYQSFQNKRGKEVAIMSVQPVDLIHGELDAKTRHLVERWIELNKTVLLKFWNNGYQAAEDMEADLRHIDRV